MFRRGGFWSGFFRVTAAGVRASGNAIPGNGMADLASVFAFIAGLVLAMMVIRVPYENGVPIFLLDIGIALVIAAAVNRVMRIGLANLQQMRKK